MDFPTALANSLDPRTRIWKQLTSSSPAFAITRIKIIESSLFEQQTIDLTPATALVGAHGAGKTVLLRLMEAVLGWTVNSPPFIGRRRYQDYPAQAATAVCEVTVAAHNETLTQTVDLSDDEETRSAIWDEGIAAPYWCQYASSVEFASDLGFYYQQLKPERIDSERRYSAKELAAVRNTLGRDYDSAIVRTVILDELETSPGVLDRSLAPYVVASTNGIEVKTEMFSLGEAWFHQVLWQLNSLDNGCAFLLDEPESFMAIRGHRPFIDEIARQSLQLQRQLIVATHSPAVLSRFPLDHVRICVRGNSGKIRVVQPDSTEQIYNSIGVEIPLKAIVLVEDSFAVKVIRSIASNLGHPIAELEIIPVGGASKVIAGTSMLQSAHQLRVRGVLDADQIEHTLSNESLKVLPGAADPERELLDYANDNLDLVGEMLGRSSDRVMSALESCSFLDHQYQIAALSRALDIDEGYLTSSLLRGWLSQERISIDALELIKWLVN